MPDWSEDAEPVLLPRADDLADVVARAGRKRRAKLRRLTAVATLPVVAAAVTFAIRAPSGRDGIELAESLPGPSERATASRPAGPAYGGGSASPRPAGTATASPRPSPRPGATSARPTGSTTVRPTQRPPASLPSAGLVPNRVEAEDGGYASPNCGDDGPMQVEEDASASGGARVFHPGDGCAQTFPALPGRVVTRIRFATGGRNGTICGWFEVGGGQIGRTEIGCWPAMEFVTVPVTAQYVSEADYRITWRVDIRRTPTYANAHVDFHEVAGEQGLGPDQPPR